MQKPLRKLENYITLENSWLYILRLLSEKPFYAYELRAEVRNRFGFRLGKVTAYYVLYRLQKDGYVTAEWRKEGYRRKYYKITRTGRTLLRNGIKTLEKFAKRLK